MSDVRRRGRARGRMLAAGAALALAVSLAPLPADAGGGADAGNHRSDHGSRQRLGRVVSTEAMPRERWLPNAGNAYRVEYVSTGFDGSRTVVSGAVYLPKGNPPKGGWRVISWAHGTVGSADVCAPSIRGASERDRVFLGAWLAKGYVIVASDYEGLGTPGPHPYTHGKSEAYGVVDMVRAARSLDKRLSRSWMVVGHSQGGQAALFTGAMASEYAPELDFRGTISSAPLSRIRMNAEGLGFLNPESPAFAYIPGVVGAHETIYGDDFNVSDLVTPKGALVYLKGQEVSCLADTVAEMKGLKMKDILDMDKAKLDDFLDKWAAYGDTPLQKYDRPVLIGQGTADPDVFPKASAATAEGLKESGSDVTLLLFEGEDHSGPLWKGVNQFLDFADTQFSGRG
ncbi:MAG: alpha/beta fold hydrolase [Dermatophilus congolensis]|nr:alpha/beta fold hydrolase [Dermatophilus congolensis]